MAIRIIRKRNGDVEYEADTDADAAIVDRVLMLTDEPLADLTVADDPNGLKSLIASAVQAAIAQEQRRLDEVIRKLQADYPELAAACGLVHGFLRRPFGEGLEVTDACLRRLITDGKLPAIRDRGWRNRRRDLEQL